MGGADSDGGGESPSWARRAEEDGEDADKWVPQVSGRGGVGERSMARLRWAACCWAGSAERENRRKGRWSWAARRKGRPSGLRAAEGRQAKREQAAGQIEWGKDFPFFKSSSILFSKPNSIVNQIKFK